MLLIEPMAGKNTSPSRMKIIIMAAKHDVSLSFGKLGIEILNFLFTRAISNCHIWWLACFIKSSLR